MGGAALPLRRSRIATDWTGIKGKFALVLVSTQGACVSHALPPPSVLLSTTTLSTVLWASTALFHHAGAAAFGGMAEPPSAPSPGPSQLPQAILESNARLVLASASQGYLGVNVRDVDPVRAQKEKLSISSGAEVVSLDHDAPRPRPVSIPAMSSKPSTASWSPTPPPSAACSATCPSVSSSSFRSSTTPRCERLHLQLADRTALVQHAWAHHFHVPIPEPAPMVQGFAAQHSYAGDGTPPDSDTDPQAYVGAEVEPITPQLAKFSASAPATACWSAAWRTKVPPATPGLTPATSSSPRTACRSKPPLTGSKRSVPTPVTR